MVRVAGATGRTDIVACAYPSVRGPDPRGVRVDLVERRQDELPPLKRVIYARPQPDGPSEVVRLVGFEDGAVHRGPRFVIEVDPSTGEYVRWHCFDPDDLLLEKPFSGLKRDDG